MFGKTPSFQWLLLEADYLQYFFPLLPDRPNTRASNKPSDLRSTCQALVYEKLIYRRGGWGGLFPSSSLHPVWSPDSPRLTYLQWQLHLSLNLPIREADAAHFPRPPPFSLNSSFVSFPHFVPCPGCFLLCFLPDSTLKPAAYLPY